MGEIDVRMEVEDGHRGSMIGWRSAGYESNLGNERSGRSPLEP
jgi:hypothetical protein